MNKPGNGGTVRDGNGGEAGDKFADYIKFDDLFGASTVFTSGTARQRKKETDAYIKDVMERRLYGYAHRLYTHGAPIDRVAIGKGCEEDCSDGIDLTAKAAQHSGSQRPRNDGGAAGDQANGRHRKQARMSALRHAGMGPQQNQVNPRTPMWNGRGRPSDGSMRMPGGSAGIKANLFELGDWEADPVWAAIEDEATSLWAAMEEAVAQGVVGTMEDPSNLLGNSTKPNTRSSPSIFRARGSRRLR